MNKIKVLDLIDGKASIEDVEFGWRMFMAEHGGNGRPLAVIFEALLETPDTNWCVNAEKNEKDLYGKVLDKCKRMHPSIAELGKAKLNSKNYDRFVLYQHADEVGDLTRAKKYFKDHNVNDVDPDALFAEAVENGDIPKDQADRLRK